MKGIEACSMRYKDIMRALGNTVIHKREDIMNALGDISALEDYGDCIGSIMCVGDIMWCIRAIQCISETS